MNSLSRVAFRASAQTLRRVGSNPVVASSVRLQSSIIDAKEHAEETRFIRSMEAKRQAELRAEMERILALEDNHDEKKGLVELLGEYN